MVRRGQWLAETVSTNSDALSLAGDCSLELPYLIGADRQTGGRGRGKNAWWSSAGALTFSLILEPDQFAIQQQQWPRISLATGVAVGECLAAVVESSAVQLKWPNDVFLPGRKVAGILVETSSNAPGRFVIGIGINVNNSVDEAPEEVQRLMASLRSTAGHPFDRMGILSRLLIHLERELILLGEAASEQLDRFRERCLLTHEFVTVTNPNEEVSGLCLGIDDDGALRLQTEYGPTTCRSGTVRRCEGEP